MNNKKYIQKNSFLFGTYYGKEINRGRIRKKA